MTGRLRRFFLTAFQVVFLSMTIQGCGVVVVAGLGALGGYVISPDTVEGVVGYSDDELYASGQDILSIMGSINQDLKSDGHLSAIVTGVRVTVDILPVSKSTTKLRVKARKWIFPKIAVAQDVYMKIMRRLQE